jgi:hypothetical protein
MAQRELEWALRLRADLSERADHLRSALAEIEPLRLELGRLEEQLKGVDRLIAVYHDHLGLAREDAPAPGSLVAVRDEEAPAEAPGESFELAACARTGLAAFPGVIGRDLASLGAMIGAGVARGYLGLRRWLIQLLHRLSAQL